MIKDYSKIGTMSIGIRMPIIKQDDDLKNIIVENTLNSIDIDDDDIICVTESIVARSEGNYVSVDDIANDIRNKYGINATVGVLWPIYSRNRFSMILKGIARGAKHIVLQLNHGKDEVGNDMHNKFTGVYIIQYYKDIIESEGCEVSIVQSDNVSDVVNMTKGNVIVSTIHSRNDVYHKVLDYIEENPKYANGHVYKLSDLCSCKINETIGYNEEFGLLGSNKADEERLKLFPKANTCNELANYIIDSIFEKTGKKINVIVYGDGCFKDPIGGIWEFADPVTCPGYGGETLTSRALPNEYKMKYFIDTYGVDEEGFKSMLKNKKDESLVGNMAAQGTTPRRYFDLLASLADLTSGSGDKGTPVIVIKNYFKNYAS